MKVTRPVYGVKWRSTSNPTPIEIDWLTTRTQQKDNQQAHGFAPLALIARASRFGDAAGGINTGGTIGRGGEV